MSSHIVTDIIAGYENHFKDTGDPRVQNWPLMGTPTNVVLISAAYIYFVKFLGPSIMESRKPFGLKTIITIYNIGQVIACTVIFWGILTSGWTTHLSLGCEPIDYSYKPLALRMTRFVWWTMCLKLLEFMETIFFVLRKKNNQISGLHIYHHVSTLLITWVGTKFIAGGMATFCIMLNCLVHIIMYIYYLLAAAGSPRVKMFICKWKKYLTMIQMAQFCIIVAHASQALLPHCHVQKGYALIFIPNVLLVFYLFYHFYKDSYKKKNKSKSS